MSYEQSAQVGQRLVTSFRDVDPTGVADSSAGIQACVTALFGTGTRPIFPAGTYKIVAPVTCPGPMAFWADVAGPVVFTGAGAASVANMTFTMGAAPGTPAYNPAWYAATDVYLDPVGGNDANNGTTALTPVQTMAEVVRRYGSAEPALVYGQSLTVHQLSAQTAGVDVFLFQPRISGGGEFLWDALTSAAPVGAPFSPTTVTAKLQANPGSDLILNGALPGGIAAKQIVHNVTKNSYAMVQGVAAGSATITQPFTLASLTTPVLNINPVQDNTWANTDSYQLLAPLALNAESLAPGGGDVNVAKTTGSAWVLGVHLVDAAGTTSKSFFTIKPAGATTVWSLCVIDPATLVSGDSEYGVALLSCIGATLFLSSTAQLIGGASAFTVMVGLGGLIDGDAILTGFIGVNQAANYFGSVHLAGACSVFECGTIFLEANYFTAITWGAGSIDLTDVNCGVFNATAGPWANCLKVATLTIGGVATGSSFNAAAAGNPFTPGIAITSANLDTGGGAGNPGLQNPRTGSRYAST